MTTQYVRVKARWASRLDSLGVQLDSASRVPMAAFEVLNAWRKARKGKDSATLELAKLQEETVLKIAADAAIAAGFERYPLWRPPLRSVAK